MRAVKCIYSVYYPVIAAYFCIAHRPSENYWLNGDNHHASHLPSNLFVAQPVIDQEDEQISLNMVI